jgi:hypothetical protein
MSPARMCQTVYDFGTPLPNTSCVHCAASLAQVEGHDDSSGSALEKTKRADLKSAGHAGCTSTVQTVAGVLKNTCGYRKLRPS